MQARSPRSRVGATATALVILACLQTALADLLCTQFGTNTFRVGSTLKFQWNNTQTTDISSFNLNLYCFENSKLIMPNIVSNLSTLYSPSPVNWVVPSDITTHASECQLSQYYAAFVWPTNDPETGAASEGMTRCMIMLFINPNAPNTVTGPGADEGGQDGNGGEENPGPARVDEHGNIIVSDKTKSIVIGVGCAVGVLVLSGIVGFYVIRYRNKRAAEDERLRKLREPIHPGPLFPPSTNNSSGRSTPTFHAGGNHGTIPATAHTARLGHSRYNELSSTASGSDVSDQYSSRRHSRNTEMSELGGGHAVTPMTAAHTSINMQHPPRTVTPPPATTAALARPHTPTLPSSPSMSPGPLTPIAAAHAKAFRGDQALSPTMSYASSPLSPSQQQAGSSAMAERPVSVLTSSFTPMEEEDRKKKQQQYELQAQHQQQQQQQLQQQQQMQQYMNYGSY